MGYALSSNTLNLPINTLNLDYTLHKKSSINTLYKKIRFTKLKFTDLLFGELSSLGSKLQSYGYNTIPSHVFKYPFNCEKYFSGGFIIQKYGSCYDENKFIIDAIQIE